MFCWMGFVLMRIVVVEGFLSIDLNFTLEIVSFENIPVVVRKYTNFLWNSVNKNSQIDLLNLLANKSLL